MRAIVIGTLSTITERIDKGTEGAGNERKSGEHPNYSFVALKGKRFATEYLYRNIDSNGYR